jgi:hypothetical protein
VTDERWTQFVDLATVGIIALGLNLFFLIVLTFLNVRK